MAETKQADYRHMLTMLEQEDWYEKGVELEEMKQFHAMMQIAAQENLQDKKLEIQKAMNDLIMARLKEEERIQKENIQAWLDYLKLKAKLYEEGSPSQLFGGGLF